MPEVMRWGASIVAIGVLGLVLHWVAGLFRPRIQGDPRLGPAGFWVWVAAVALFVHFVLVRWNLLPPFRLPVPEFLKWVFLGLWVVGWLAKRFGLLESPEWLEDTEEDHEEAWATLVGAILGFALPPLVVGALAR